MTSLARENNHNVFNNVTFSKPLQPLIYVWFEFENHALLAKNDYSCYSKNADIHFNRIVSYILLKNYYIWSVSNGELRIIQPTKKTFQKGGKTAFIWLLFITI